MSEKTRQMLLAARPSGKAKLSDFTLREISLRNPGDGELLLRGYFLSLDPYMRGRMDDRESYAEPAHVGDMMPGESVCVVEASHHPDYEPAMWFWRLPAGKQLHRLSGLAADLSFSIMRDSFRCIFLHFDETEKVTKCLILLVFLHFQKFQTEFESHRPDHLRKLWYSYSNWPWSKKRRAFR